ncbi:MAG: integration host factor subunit beta [Blastocatellia bacterium]|nr:integration host factor subunit beta [Blastocatellia bacterium]
MTKADLARAVYERHGGISLQDAQRIVDGIFTIIKQKLLDGDRVHIVGFGTLEIVTRRPRRGRNPATGETIELPEKRALVFRPSRAMRSV